MTAVTTRSNTGSTIALRHTSLSRLKSYPFSGYPLADSPLRDSPRKDLFERSNVPRSPLPPSTLVVIDPTVEDAPWLAAGVQEDATPFILNAHQDGITQITDYLRQHPNVDRLALVAHGGAGCLTLGSTLLTADSLENYADQWPLWRHQLQQVMFFGCEVAAQAAGQQFLNRFHQAVGGAIAAATHPIGNTTNGGCWRLDVQLGNVQMGQVNLDSPFRSVVHQQYRGVLGILVVNSADDNTIAGDGLVTLREAIAAANGDTTTDLGDQGIGIDTIVFDTALAGSTINLTLGELLIDTNIILDGSTTPGVVISGSTVSRVFTVTGGTSTFNAVTIADGAATDGAGIRVEDASLILQNSLLTGNVDAGSGGALYASNATLVITNTTITGNRSADFGAGMTLENGTNAAITFSTIADNQGSGIDRVGDSTLTIGHTLLADNTRGNIPLSSTNTTSLNYNLTDDITVGLNQTRDQIARSDTAINLGSLGDYGGPTQTLALLPGSIAIDGGDPTSTVANDQRGVTRPVLGRFANRVDIGAFEAAIPLVTVNALTTDDNTPPLTGTVTLPGGVVVPELEVSVIVDGTTYTTTTRDGTWALADDTLNLLEDGTYDVQVSVTNVSGTGTDTTTNELVIDATAPVVTVDALSTNDRTPVLTGTITDITADITVTVAGTDYAATNNGNGNWILEEGAILTPLEDGTYDVVVTAVDALGNVGTDDTDNELVIDSTSPQVAIAPRITNDSTPALTGLVDDATATVEVTINRATYTAINDGNGNWILPDDRIDPSLPDGTYDIFVAAIDAAGNRGTASLTDALTIDATPATITVDNLLTRDQTPGLSGTISEATSLIEITVNGNTYTATNNGNNTWSLPDDRIFPALTDGIYDVTARAIDIAGNESFDTTTEELEIDNTPPTVTITPRDTNDNTPELTGTVNDPTATITVTLNEVDYTATNNEDGTWTLPDGTITTELADGTYDVVVTATDPLGNEGIDTSTDELLIDTEQPEVTVNPLVTSNNSPELTGTVNDDTATVIVTVNGAEYMATTNTDGTWTLAADSIAALADGTYDVQVVATDPVGNEGTDDTTDELLIDTTAPEVFVDSVITNDTTPELTGTVNEATAAVTVTVDGETYTATNNGDGTWTLADDTVAELPNGTFDVEVRATDNAGNEGVDGTIDELTVDAIAPTISLDDLNTDDPSPELSGTINDDTATIQVTVNRTNYTATNNGDGTWTLADNTIPDLDDNIYDVEVSAIDAATNVGRDTASLRIDTTAPVVTVNELGTTDTTPELTGTISETDATLEVTVNGVPYTATNNGDGTWVLADGEINPLQDGTYDVAVVATDIVGNTGTDDTTDELLIDTEAPRVSINELRTNDPSPPLTGDIDDPNALVQVTIGRNSYAATNVGDGTWILADGTIDPDLADGVYDIEVTASDSVNNIGTDTTTNELLIDATAPVVTVDTLLTTDTTPELTGDVDDDSATVEVTVNGVAYTATNNQNGTWTLPDGTISPELDDGTYDIEVTATDTLGNIGTDTTTDELVVDTIAPTVTVNSLTTNDNTPTLTGNLDDASADLTISVNGTAFTVTDVGNGTWSFTLSDPLDDGTYEVTATATDAVGNVGTDTTSNELLIDTIAPQVGINRLRTNDPTPALSGTVDDPAATVQIGIGPQAFTATNNGDGTWTLPNNTITTPLADGTYDLKVAATDSVGNRSLDTTTNELVIDTAAPVVTVNTLRTNDDTPTLAGTLNDPTATLRLRVNGAVFTVTDVENNSWSFTLPEPLDDGTYNVAARATDTVGNVGTDATSNELFIDTIAPRIGVNSRRTNDPTPALTGTVNDPTARVRVSVGTQTVTATNNGNGTWTVPNNAITTPLADGTYNIRALAIDSVGNRRSDATTNELVIDRTPPTADIVNVTPDPRGPVPAIAINFSEAVSGMNVSDFTLRRDGVPVSLAGATLQSGNGINWTLGSLTNFTALTADYTLTLRPGGTNIRDAVGNLLQLGATDSWRIENFTATGLPAPASINGQLGTSPGRIRFRGGRRGIREQGNGGANRIVGTNGRDRLEGKGGRDRIFGQRGNDRLFGDNGNDRLFGRGGADRIQGGNGNDRLEGDGGRDRLEGGRGSDRLLGGRGSDILIGGGGGDRLTGNGGRDQFVYEDLNDGVDTITDFNTTDDLIDLSGILSSSQFAAASGFAKITQFVRLRQLGTSTEVSIDADGNGSGIDLQAIVVLEGINADAVVSTNFLA